MLPERVSEHKRRALRLFLGVLIPCSVGYGVVGPEHLALSKDVQTIAKWAAITAAIVGAQPLIGKATQVGADRVLGTVLGGFCGAIVHTLGHDLLFNEYTDGAWLTFAAATLAGCAVLVGKRLRLEMSARLFTITLLLVTFAGDAGTGAWRIAAVRCGGIVAGVVIMLVLSVLVLPSSATVECLHCVDRALTACLELYDLCWTEYLPLPLAEAAAASSLSPAPGATPSPGSLSRTPLLADEGGSGYQAVEGMEERCEGALSRVYSSLFALHDTMPAAKSERLVGRWAGHLVLVPGDAFHRRQVEHLPWEGLASLATTARRLARGLFTLAQALEDGADEEAEAAVPHARILLATAAAVGHAALQDVREAFPTRRSVPAGNILAFLQAVEAWEGATGQEQQAALRSARRYQQSTSYWAHLTDAVKARCQQGRQQGQLTEQGQLAEQALGGSQGVAKAAPAGSSPASGSTSSLASALSFADVEITSRALAEHAAGAAGAPAAPPEGAAGGAQGDWSVAATARAQAEWLSLALLLREVGLELAELHQRTSAVLTALP